MSEKKEVKQEVKKTGFTKDQLLKSKQYAGVQRDIMSAVLDDNGRYTHNQVKKALDDFGKGKVI